ncbi:MAG: DUF192 domain-containing protein [Raoultibacter sp.]
MNQRIEITNEAGVVLFSQARIMNNLIQRVIGLMGRRTIDPHAAYLFPRCASVHTCFMRVSIDLIFIDETRRVLAVETLRPWHVSRRVKGTAAIIEAACGSARAKRIGQTELLHLKGGRDV